MRWYLILESGVLLVSIPRARPAWTYSQTNADVHVGADAYSDVPESGRSTLPLQEYGNAILFFWFLCNWCHRRWSDTFWIHESERPTGRTLRHRDMAGETTRRDMS